MNQNTVLFLKASKDGNQAQILKLLLKPDIDVNASDEDGMTALHYAVMHHSSKVVEQLLRKQNIDANKINNQGKSPLHLAAEYPNKTIIDALISYLPFNPQRSLADWSFLFLAAFKSDNAFMIDALCKRPDLNPTEFTRTTNPVYAASSLGCIKCLATLLNSHRFPENLFNAHYSPILESVKSSHFNCTKLLFKHTIQKSGADSSPLIRHLINDDANGVSSYLSTHPNAVNEHLVFSFHPLHVAVFVSSVKSAAVLLQCRADANAEDQFQSSPLFYAASAGNMHIAKMLLQSPHILPNLQNSSFDTPLHSAVAHGWTQMTQLLLADTRTDTFLINA